MDAAKNIESMESDDIGDLLKEDDSVDEKTQSIDAIEESKSPHGSPKEKKITELTKSQRDKKKYK